MGRIKSLVIDLKEKYKEKHGVEPNSEELKMEYDNFVENQERLTFLTELYALVSEAQKNLDEIEHCKQRLLFNIKKLHDLTLNDKL